MYDLLIKNAKSINNESIYISIHKGKIVAINSQINNEEQFHQIIDIKQQFYVSSGWIDIRTHCFDKFEVYSDDCDVVGYKSGVTTVVDAGTSGYNDIEEFYQKAKKCKTNVFSLLNISRIGLLRQDELSDFTNVDSNLVKEAVKKYSDFVVGLKIRLSKTVVGDTNLDGLRVGKSLAKQLKLPVMIHIGSEPPLLQDILHKLDKGDIVTHIFNGKSNGILDATNTIKKEVFDAKSKGVLFDIGHGTDSFNFHVAKEALKNNIKADTISSDIYRGNRMNGPVYSLSNTMSKMLNIGYTLEEVIDKVTTSASTALLLANKGKLEVGYDADITFFDIQDTNKMAYDSQKESIVLEKEIIPYAVVINGEWIVLEKENV